MEERGIVPNEVCYNAAIRTCGAFKQWQEAIRLFERMDLNPALRPNVQSYNSVMSACAKDGQWRPALELLNGMKHKQIKPSKIR